MKLSFPRFLHQRKTRCSICGNPVALEMSKTDEQGCAVHEECYVGRTLALLAAQPQSAQRASIPLAILHVEEINAVPPWSRLV